MVYFGAICNRVAYIEDETLGFFSVLMVFFLLCNGGECNGEYANL